MYIRNSDCDIFFNYPSEEEAKAAQAVCCGRPCNACEAPAAYAWRKRGVDMSILLERAMESELTGIERDTLRAFWFESLSVSEIARLRKISTAAVSDTIARAKEKLKRTLKYAVMYQHDILNEETALPMALARAKAIAAARNAASNSVGEKIRHLRESQGISCSEMSNALGMTAQRLKAIEEGKPMYARELVLMSGFFGVTADYLMSSGSEKKEGTANA